jgi:hypothetical protein
MKTRPAVVIREKRPRNFIQISSGLARAHFPTSRSALASGFDFQAGRCEKFPGKWKT